MSRGDGNSGFPVGPAVGYAPGGAMSDDLPLRRTYLQQVVHDTLVPVASRLGLAWVVCLAFFAVTAPFIANSHPILMQEAGRWSSPMLKSLEPADIVLPVAAIAAAVLLVRRKLSAGQGLGMVAWVSAVTYAATAWPSVRPYYATLRGARLELLSVWAAWTLLGFAGAMVAMMIVLLPIFVLPRRATMVASACLAPLVVLTLVFPVRPPELVVYERYRQKEKSGQITSVLRTLVPYSANDRLRDQPELRLTPPRRGHPLGTEPNGADVLSRMIHASRIALSIGFIATGIAVVVGVIVGGLMGYFVGTVDLLGMRLIEIFQAIPRLVLLVAITASYGRSLYLMMAVIGMLSWTGDARFIRAEFLKLRKEDFVQAAVAAGLPLRSILFRHMLPNGIAPVLVSASFGVASAILLESTLSFLGLGLVDEPSWGQMLNQAREGSGFNWWIALFPGAAIFLTVFAYNLVGESLRDALDPKLLKRE